MCDKDENIFRLSPLGGSISAHKEENIFVQTCEVYNQRWTPRAQLQKVMIFFVETITNHLLVDPTDTLIETRCNILFLFWNIYSQSPECVRSEMRMVRYIYVSGFEKRGHFGPVLNYQILICTEIIGNQQSFTACFMFIAAWNHLLCTFI